MSPTTGSADTPRQRVMRESARVGRTTLVEGCVALLRGHSSGATDGDPDDELVLVLGGPHAGALLAQEEDYPGQRYWLRVWAARGLLWCWEEAASGAVYAALDDDAWRVRERALKVIARHRVDGDVEKVAALQDDPVARVRSAAHRALISLTAD